MGVEEMGLGTKTFETSHSVMSAVTLYVGDLTPRVTESHLLEVFQHFEGGSVTSVLVCREPATRRSLGYGYVTFQTPTYAEKAISTLQHVQIDGRPIHLQFSFCDPPSVPVSSTTTPPKVSKLKKVKNNKDSPTPPQTSPDEAQNDSAQPNSIFVRDLPPSITEEELRELFSRFGEITNIWVKAGPARARSVIQFAGDTTQAIKEMNEKLVGQHTITVEPQKSAEEAKKLGAEKRSRARRSNLYVKNLHASIESNHLLSVFRKYGKINSAHVMRDEKGKSKGFGFVSFHEPEAAEEALVSVKQIFGRDVEICVAQTKAERSALLAIRHNPLLLQDADMTLGQTKLVNKLKESHPEPEALALAAAITDIYCTRLLRNPKRLRSKIAEAQESLPK